VQQPNKNVPLPRDAMKSERFRSQYSRCSPTQQINLSTANPSFAEVKLTAQQNIRAIVTELLPGTELRNGLFWSLNPTRNDQHVGSFYVNAASGSWCDKATDDGGDIIHLVAYLKGISNNDARKWLAGWLGLTSNFSPTARAANISKESSTASNTKVRKTDLTKLLQGVVDPPNTPVDVYLQSRGLSL
jgi:hypothetical protein